MLLDGNFVSVLKKGRGNGRCVVLLHGYLSRKESFYYQINALAGSGYTAVAPDFPGFGASGALNGAWSVGDYADWLKRFLYAEGLCAPSVIAHSFGARVAIKLFSECGYLADKLVITGGAGVVKPRSPAYIRQVTRYRRIKKIFPGYAERHFGSEEYRSLPPVMRESYKKIVNEDLQGCATKINNKVLLIYGKDDKVTPVEEEGRIFNMLMPNSRLETVNGGHFCFSEEPEGFNRLMLGFLDGGL